MKLRTPDQIPNVRVVTLAGREVDVAIRPSVRARKLRLVVRGSTAIEAVVPTGVRTPEIERFLAVHHSWLLRAVTDALRREATTPRLGLDRPNVVWLGGVARPVTSGRTHGRPTIQLHEDTVVIAGDPSCREAALDRWYREQARLEIEDATVAEADRLGLRYARIAIRDQKTRWGSCSTNGTLSFSWRLVVAPRRILDYVVCHELLHLKELNHSSRFWTLVDEARPTWRDEVAWLRDHGRELHSYDFRRALDGPPAAAITHTSDISHFVNR